MFVKGVELGVGLNGVVRFVFLGVDFFGDGRVYVFIKDIFWCVGILVCN